jgi:hypothetical protein
MKFKKGDDVRCVNANNYDSRLTINKRYIVIKYYNNCAYIIDDTGVKYGYDKSRFELVKSLDWTPEKGELALVRDGCGDWVERIFIIDLGEKYTGRYLCEMREQPTSYLGWEQIKKLEPVVTELTIDEIAKKFNIPVEQLKIKK